MCGKKFEAQFVLVEMPVTFATLTLPPSILKVIQLLEYGFYGLITDVEIPILLKKEG